MRDLVIAEKASVRHVLDIGSLDINGSYRELWPGVEYVGVDLQSGPGVDFVGPLDELMEDHGWHRAFSLVISGQALEHDAHPGRTVSAMLQCVAPGGVLVLIAPFEFPHHHPPDYWRFTGEGLALLVKRGLRRRGVPPDLRHVSSGIAGGDAWATYRMPVGH